MSSKPQVLSPLQRLLAKKKEGTAAADPPRPVASSPTPEPQAPVPQESLTNEVNTHSVSTTSTIAQHATVALPATVAQDATVASEPSQQYPDATVASGATEAPNATEALEATVEIKGYGAFTWDLLDRVMPKLDPYEQSVLLRLCRLSWGYKQDTCRVGYDALQKACNLKKRKLQEVVAVLEFMQFIRRLEVEQGGPDRHLRGTLYQILLTPPPGVQRATVALDATVAQDATGARGATNKKNALKDSSKGDSRSRAENCPDCAGTGYYYPRGFNKGVARCRHEKLKEAGK